MNCSNCGESLHKSKVIAKQNDIRFNCYNTKKRIVQCSKCELVQLIPQWSDKELDKIYTTYNQKPDFIGQKNISKRISKWIKKYLVKVGQNLEVGCGNGDTVKYFKTKMYNIMGIDKDKSVEKCYEGIYNYDIYDKKFDKDLYHAKFYFIYGLHILEHMKNPIKFIERLKELLFSEGTILLEFPNLEDPLLTIYKSKEFEKFYYRPDHHFFYTPKTIMDLLYRNKVVNCQIKRTQTYSIVNHLNWLIRKKPTNLKINLPIIDFLYKWCLVHIFKKSDTILLIIKK
jgi:2-polyprenyl-3-methyl-5-hydroxy-6-metoxy-1,4-benzoquinol methylase